MIDRVIRSGMAAPPVMSLARRMSGHISVVGVLWAVVAVSAVGDVMTTHHGLAMGFQESNPVARAALMSHGVLGLIAVKVGAIAVGATGWMIIPESHRWVVPASLSGPWVIAVGVNMVALYA